ncbi:MAG: Fic family protein [Rectinemataceae bacterium]
MEHLGLKHREHFRLDILQPLIEGGLLDLTIPDKPKSPKQNYVTRPKADPKP